MADDGEHFTVKVIRLQDALRFEEAGETELGELICLQCFLAHRIAEQLRRVGDAECLARQSPIVGLAQAFADAIGAKSAPYEIPADGSRVH